MKVKIFDDEGNMIGTRMQIKGKLFYLDPMVDMCLFSRIEDVWLWYKRLCHVIFKNMVKIGRKKRVRGLPNLQNLIILCEKNGNSVR